MKSFRSVLVTILWDTIALVLATLFMRFLYALDRIRSGRMMALMCGKRWNTAILRPALTVTLMKDIQEQLPVLITFKDCPNVRSPVSFLKSDQL